MISERLHYGYDFNGRICGVGAMVDRPYVYYPFPYPDDMQSGSLDGADFTWATCVKSCPNPDVAMTGLSIPNSCMQKFMVRTEEADQTSLVFKMAKTVTCGGNADGTTDMSQFGALTNFLGYRKYCLKHTPLCKCKAPETPASACCLPDAKGEEEGAQVFTNRDTNLPETRVFQQNVTVEKEREQFNIPMGHRYGFCYVPYPSYVPGGEDADGSWTRCIPQINGVGASSNTTTSYASSLSSVEASMGKTATSDAEKQKSMESSLKAVIDSMSGKSLSRFLPLTTYTASGAKLAAPADSEDRAVLVMRDLFNNHLQYAMSRTRRDSQSSRGSSAQVQVGDCRLRRNRLAGLHSVHILAQGCSVPADSYHHDRGMGASGRRYDDDGVQGGIHPPGPDPGHGIGCRNDA